MVTHVARALLMLFLLTSFSDFARSETGCGKGESRGHYIPAAKENHGSQWFEKGPYGGLVLRIVRKDGSEGRISKTDLDLPLGKVPDYGREFTFCFTRKDGRVVVSSVTQNTAKTETATNTNPVAP